MMLVKVMDDLVGVDLPFGDAVAVVVVDVDALGEDHLHVAVDVVDYREFERRWEGFFEGFAHELGLLLAAFVPAYDLG